jgi:hypothetical protein
MPPRSRLNADFVLSTTEGSVVGAEKFEAVFCGGKVYHAEEAAGQLVVAGRNGAVELEMAEQRSMRLRCL